MAGLLEQFGGVEERLRRNAPDIEAGSAERRILLDDGDVEPDLGGANGADIAAGAAADDDEIVGQENSKAWLTGKGDQGGLLLGVAAEPISAEVDDIAVFIGPIDRVAELIPLHFHEAPMISAEECEDLSLRKERPDIDHTLIAVVECELQDAEDHRLHALDPGELLFHLIFSGLRPDCIAYHESSNAV